MKTLIISCALLLFHLTLNFSMESAVNSWGTYKLEEATASFRNVAVLENRLQFDSVANSFGTYAYFWAGSKVMPNIDLYYARHLKSFAMAFISPLIFLIALESLGITLLTSLWLALLTPLIPGIY
jgi:hypothetical protein